ncbi:tol-pal system-associated acyl-CoA thioesterase [Szabonella alba]|uniref:Tol-pal system-associated acyl-CoA thioesterase n=1 Tax=Szabonella alba TaxID=2804194 RepID=A0A8K0VAU1_9RHOB|nr:tol-pal system-associated acyl-CoA thioesterase [Szabonella alba]MBL4915852.1 tol-pal system-associated acyl-CoA thioesterase [Szabonella alba]
MQDNPTGPESTTEGRFLARVYYEDTDLAGIVYHANYLKFIERARSEWLRERGIDQMALKAESGIVFAVRHLEALYLAPARFDDILEMRTRLTALSGARIGLDQSVWRGDQCLFEARVTLVCLSERGAVRIPAALRAALAP